MDDMNGNEYSIVKTRLFEEQLRDIVLYVAESAQDIQPSLKLLSEIEKTVQTLVYFPKRGARPHDRRLRSLDYRFITVGSYIIFYSISDELHTVTTLAIVHTKQQYVDILGLEC